MNEIYIASQIAGFLAFVLSLVAYHRKEKKKIFQTMTISNILEMIHYILLNAYSGFITKLIALIRNEIIILKEKNSKINSKKVLVILLIVYVIAGILTYKNIYSILPILAASIYLFFVWDGDELKVKKVAFYCYFLWLIYNICILSIAGVTSSIVSIVSTYVALRNEERKEREK